MSAKPESKYAPPRRLRPKPGVVVEHTLCQFNACDQCHKGDRWSSEMRRETPDGTRNASRPSLNPAEVSMSQDNIDWQRDVDAALAEAKRTNKPLLLDFTAAPA